MVCPCPINDVDCPKFKRSVKMQPYDEANPPTCLSGRPDVRESGAMGLSPRIERGVVVTCPRAVTLTKTLTLSVRHAGFLCLRIPHIRADEYALLASSDRPLRRSPAAKRLICVRGRAGGMRNAPVCRVTIAAQCEVRSNAVLRHQQAGDGAWPPHSVRQVVQTGISTARGEAVQSTRQPSDALCHRSHPLKDDGHANPRRNRYWPSCCGSLTFGLATMNAGIGGQHRPVALGANGDSSGHLHRLVPLCRYLVA